MDALPTVVAILVFVFLAWQAGRLLNRFKHRRFTRAWQPLIGIIDGTVHEDPQGGGASSWLLGQWKGKTIHARMTPQLQTVERTFLHNQFAVGVAEQKGRTSWRADRTAVSADDGALADRLRRAGVVALLEGAECEVGRFDRPSGYLFVEEIVDPLWVPPPERFVVLLDLAVELARIQGEENTP